MNRGKRLPGERQLRLRRVLVVVAHPDDELIAAGSRLASMQGLAAIVHITDGAPRDGFDARRAGFMSPAEYAAARRREFQQAMEKAGATRARQVSFSVPDQEASYALSKVARRLAAVFAELRPGYVLTHPYEGGHPDHDATAAAVQLAVRLLARRRVRPPVVVEFACYHNSPQGMETERFLPRGQSKQRSAMRDHYLAASEREKKKALFAIYASQADVLKAFAAENEALRLAPAYNFAAPPHRGRLLYEKWGWKTPPATLRRRIQRSFSKFGLRCEY